jgi:hypothetical protein
LASSGALLSTWLWPSFGEEALNWNSVGVERRSTLLDQQHLVGLGEFTRPAASRPFQVT